MTWAQTAGTHRYGLRWMPTWPHVNLGLSVHFSRQFGHVSLHVPTGVVIVGFVGDDQPEAPS